MTNLMGKKVKKTENIVSSYAKGYERLSKSYKGKPGMSQKIKGLFKKKKQKNLAGFIKKKK